MKKFKTRYLALKVECDGKFNRDSFWRNLIETYLRLYGEYGLSKANLRLLEFRENRFAILSANHNALPYLRAALMLIRELDGMRTIIHVLGVSGTVKRLKAKFLPVDVGKS
ncbi:ribonuclease P protein component 2 [Candidatus Bathyarchaeota archaeon]|nr:ribonuclease P protein component 2 [Candidatus Bathyarchaeota archaeon]MBS7613815.1 ribonuclease P protein component 2 [Candidatus Bathyarchaeota archaeon]MBS7617986.1 ribonuclease P protein component 2 [Candidatus Bathyarchaeota archaeon]